MDIEVRPKAEKVSECDCCNQTSRTFWGEVVWGGDAVAVYYVHHTQKGAEPPPRIDLIVGQWGDGTDRRQRALVSMLYKPGPGGGLMVVDAADHAERFSTVCGGGMRRDEVVGTALAQEVFAIVDQVFLQDPRMPAVQALS